jgi:transcription termination factor Rho
MNATNIETIKNSVINIIKSEIVNIWESKHWEYANQDIYIECSKIDQAILKSHGDEIRQVAINAVDEAILELQNFIKIDVLNCLHYDDFD